MNSIPKNILLGLTLLGLLLTPGCKKDDDSVLPGEIPAIASISPGEGSISTELTITGDNFMAGAAVYIGDKACNQVEVASSTIIYARVPSGIPVNTLLPVKVKNPTGGEIVLSNAFKAIEPVLTFVNSATKPSGNVGSTVILEGRAFGDLKADGEVLFSDGEGGSISAIISADDWTDEFIVTTVPNGAQDGPVLVRAELGESNEIPFKVTAAATFSPSTINWTETTPLPLAVSGHKALSFPVENNDGITSQYVFVSGGRNSEGQASDQVFSGIINANGTISSWTSSTSMPGPRSFHASVAATPFNSKIDGSGYLFVLGGTDSDGDAVSGVYTAALNTDGSLQGWSNARPLPQPLYSAGAVIFRSTIYVAGGASVENTPVTSVYKARINEDGELDEWESMPDLPVGIACHGFVSFGGYLYTVGGETGDVQIDADSQNAGTDQIFYSRINLRTGEIGDWAENTYSIGKERSKHSTLVLGGNIFISSGLYSGAGGSSENAYAEINSDGTIKTFNGSTGNQTLFSTGGSNLFNQAGISYIDSDGVAHVMILGGAKVGSPAIKLDKVLFY